MAHCLDFKSSGEARMAYTGETPWHGFGVKLPAFATTAEMLCAAGLNWTAKRQPLVAKWADENGADTELEVSSHYAIVRDEDSKVLGVVPETYTIIQNADAFGWGDDLLGGGAHWETAGCLDEGRRVWCLARIPETVEVIKGDPVNVFLLIANSFDESLALCATVTPVRVVCQNTLSMSLRGRSRVYRLLHTAGVRWRMDQASEVLGLSREYVGLFSEEMRTLAGRMVTGAEVAKFRHDLFPGDPDMGGADELAISRRRILADAIDGGAGTDIVGVRGTAYGLFQAAAEVIDHNRELKIDRRPRDASRRVEQQAVAVTLGGSRQALKQQALGLALDLCK